MNKRDRLSYYSRKTISKHLKKIRRATFKKRKKAGFHKHILNIIKKARFNRKNYTVPSFETYFHKSFVPANPEYPENIKYLASLPELFSKGVIKDKEERNGFFEIPSCFSLIENYQESFYFLKKLFACLYREKVEKITLDYSKCTRIDVDASVCMDILLADFIFYLKKCASRGLKKKPYQILPINYDKPEILKTLFSIGAYRNLKGYEIKFQDIEPLPLIVGIRNRHDSYEKCELDLTNIVEYTKRCLERLNRSLTIEAEDNLYKVLGEIMINAEEHGSMPFRYAIGHFQDVNNSDEHFGIFNFSIFNFGNTIYETFKNPNCPKKVVEQMKVLSDDYTKRKLFKTSEFEEETLWTLYALQQGVTSKEQKRGNGSIQFIESFFKLKGDLENDNISKLLIVSGNTRILFDGSYNIIQKEKPGIRSKYKMITFNKSGNIREKPDKEFVTFAENYFPGTIISARILIKFNNTNTE